MFVGLRIITVLLFVRPSPEGKLAASGVEVLGTGFNPLRDLGLVGQRKFAVAQ